jgi:glycosyltransferase involved in cell wall biosynthesis
MTIFFDKRWYGDHGIGRFAREFGARINHIDATLSGSPSAPLDPLFMSLALRKLTPDDTFLSPGYNAPLSIKGRMIFTIHDLNHIDVTANRSLPKWLYYETCIKHGIKKSTHVLTVSNFSRQRIIEWSGCQPEKVINVGNGVDSAFHPSSTSWQSGYRYFLCIGNRRPHKNEERLLQAFAAANLPTDIRLVFSGEATPSLLQLATTLRVGERLVFRGRVPETELPTLYRGAIALLFPSLYEGFGLPVIEAMACATPVMKSNTTSLP